MVMRRRTPNPEEAATLDACSHGSREVSLACSVLFQALNDAGLLGSPPCAITPLEKNEALTFLTANSGSSWQRAREAWLDVAGIDGGAFARRVRELIEQPSTRQHKPRVRSNARA
jgi:hypothetical protein